MQEQPGAQASCEAPCSPSKHTWPVARINVRH